MAKKIKQMSVSTYARLGSEKFTASYSKGAIMKRSKGKQIYQLPNRVYVTRRMK